MTRPTAPWQRCSGATRWIAAIWPWSGAGSSTPGSWWTRRWSATAPGSRCGLRRGGRPPPRWRWWRDSTPPRWWRLVRGRAEPTRSACICRPWATRCLETEPMGAPGRTPPGWGCPGPSSIPGASRSTTRSVGSPSKWKIRCRPIWSMPSGWPEPAEATPGSARLPAGAGRLLQVQSVLRPHFLAGGQKGVLDGGRQRAALDEGGHRLGVDGHDPVPQAQRLQDPSDGLHIGRGDVLRPAVHGRPVRAEEPAVSVLLAERVDQPLQVFQPPVPLPVLPLQTDPLVDQGRHVGGWIAVLLLVLVPEQGAQPLEVAPVAQGVLPRLELPGGDPVRNGGHPPAELVGVGRGSKRGHPLAGEQEVQREPLRLDAPDLLRREVVHRELEVPVHHRLRRQTPAGLVVDDLVPAAGDPVQPVDHAGQLHSFDLDVEPELEGGGDPEARGVGPVVFLHHLAAVRQVQGLLGGIAVALADPLAFQHLLQLLERGRHRDRAVVEPVQGPVQRVAEGEGRRGPCRKALLVLEAILGRTGLVRLDARIGQASYLRRCLHVRSSVSSGGPELQECDSIHRFSTLQGGAGKN